MGKRDIKRAFTLAEIMVVLTIIGILTAILLPSAFRNTPDENVMKFKKANNTLAMVIGELVSNEKYYKEGHLGERPNGASIYGGFEMANATTEGSTHIGSNSDITYLCNSMADIMSTKSVNCSNVKTGANALVTFVDIPSEGATESWQYTIASAKPIFDEKCSETAATVGAEITTIDDVVYYQTNPQATFGIMWNMPAGRRLFEDTIDSRGRPRIYKIICMDIDGIGTGEAPFGYGVRADGKILNGARADAWVKLSVQQKD